MIEKVSTFKDRLNEALSIRDMKPIELSEKTGISESTILDIKKEQPYILGLLLLGRIFGSFGLCGFRIIYTLILYHIIVI